MKDHKNKLEKINRGILIGLRDLSEFDKATFWVMGSVVCTALNGEYFRRIGDIDILIYEKDYEGLREFLISKGYEIKIGRPWNLSSLSGFHWIEADNGVVYIYQDKDDNPFIPLNFCFSAFLPKSMFVKREYKLYGIKFNGLSPEPLYIRTKLEYGETLLNKRIKDLEILEKNIDPQKVDQLLQEKPGLKFMGIYLPINNFINSFLKTFNLQRH